MTSLELTKNILTNKYFNNSLLPDNAKLYAIVDGAKLETLYSSIQLNATLHCCLYDGALQDHFEEAAPYLIYLDPSSDFTQTLIQNNLNNDCMILLHSTKNINDLAEHFKNYTVVYIEHLDQHALYAFYDPRVADFHFEHLSKEEIQEFLNPISCLSFTNSKRTGVLSCYYSSDNRQGWSKTDAILNKDNVVA
ncbi:hypothetical protein MNBD_GAMMA12-2478 [hydrothermal vent metagenome]|uniref:DUF4123 domain-containing protein n=1 Tax=hydrothermal vent metagenome TaxID=652676 RepID=A0A3B0YP96_9ZZZZ